MQSESSKEIATNKNTEENQDEDKLASNEIYKCIPKVYPIDSDDGKAGSVGQTSGALFGTLFQHQIRPYAARRSGTNDSNEKVY